MQPKRRRRGQNFHFSLPLIDLSIITCMLKLAVDLPQICKQTPGSSLASPGINSCCELSACWICRPSCPVLEAPHSQAQLLLGKEESLLLRMLLSDVDRTAAAGKSTNLASFQSPAKLSNISTCPLTKPIIQYIQDKLSTNKHTCWSAFPSKAGFYSIS